MSIEAMKQALEALEDATRHIWLGDKNGVEANIRGHKQCESLRQAIAEAEKQDKDCQRCGGKGCIACDAREQEPVAWGVFEGNLHDMFFTQEEADNMAHLKGTHAVVRPLYTHPKHLVGLTPEELSAIWDSMGTWNSTSAQHFYNAIWKAIKEKNT